MNLVELDRAPPMSIGRLALKRKSGEVVPRIEVRCARAEGDLGAYRRVLGLPDSPWMPWLWPQVLAGSVHLEILAHPAFPFPSLGLVHLRNRSAFLRPVRAEEPLGFRSWVEGHTVVRAGGEMDLHTEAFAGQERVWWAVTTVLTRAVKGSGPREERKEEPIRPTRSTVWSVPEDMGRRYSSVSGDRNPIHLHALAARPFGFKRAIVHGMWSLGRALAEMDGDAPLCAEVEARFRAPLELPSRVRFESGGGRFRVFGRHTILEGRLSLP